MKCLSLKTTNRQRPGFCRGKLTGNRGGARSCAYPSGFRPITKGSVRPMGKRREGREVALQLLFHWDLNLQEMPQEKDLELFWGLCNVIPGTRSFATTVLNGVIANQATIDSKITRYKANYELKRISAVDRNILRMAIYEMLYSADVPPIVAINEAIDIAKKFGTEESGNFVNGVLDRVKLDLDRPLRTASNRTG